MWVFANFGLLMPAIVDEELRARPDYLQYSDNGKFDFQVRGRIIEHLRHFQDTYMEPGTYVREIQHTPDHDYNYRFYTTQEAFKDGLSKAVMDIDYRKFKPTSERFKWGKPYHNILNSIWAAVCQMNTPGDIWGPWSEDNPKGYKSASKYGWGNKYKSSDDDDYPPVGSSFGHVETGGDGWDFPDYSNYGVDTKGGVISALEGMGIEVADWPDYCDEAEWSLVEDEYNFRMKEIERAEKQMSRSLRRSIQKRRPNFKVSKTRRVP